MPTPEMVSSIFWGSCIRLMDWAKMTAPMNTKAITAKVLAELKKVLANLGQVKSPMVKPNKTAAATPTAADSVGVAMPANKLPKTAKISTNMGHTAKVARKVSPQGMRGSCGAKLGWRRTVISM